ncbi:MAG: hypothetical protein AVDCRST_MAG19-2561 [uncultured Thermomicrobiales bacterium]|uniref:Uncharacterized protein n=1 Tax=uncultured Thermomicrobiales bacterium TaxID=1645740 RepID=A0A6J4VAI7_9BACT|nr:MAG: hypothetical protein AVDCRST_MAG19-2561 [uncultured Thermomicrobiales bacterium]
MLQAPGRGGTGAARRAAAPALAAANAAGGDDQPGTATAIGVRSTN